MRGERSIIWWWKKGLICKSYWLYKIPTMITEEIYKQIPWFEFIEVSNLWNVRSNWWYYVIINSGKYPAVRAQKEILSPILHRNIHIMVADLFLWRKEEMNRRMTNRSRDYVIVCHKDDNPQNNCVDNLYLWTPQSNADDRKRNNLLKKNAIL